MRKVLEVLMIVLFVFYLGGCGSTTETTKHLEKGSITGKVKIDGSSDKDYSGIKVAIEALGKVSYTNSSGLYIIPDIKDGTYNIEFSKTGFQTQIESVTISAGEPVEIKEILLKTEGKTKVDVVKITLNNRTLTLVKGKSEKLTAMISPLDATNQNLLWISDNSEVAQVDKNGVVTANNVGTTKINVAADDNTNLRDICNVTVVSDEVKATGLNISPESIKIVIGYNTVINATIIPENATNHKIIWSSSDSTIATIKEGIVTALKEGNVIITAKTEDGNFVKTCNVIVERIKVTGIIISEKSFELTPNQTKNLSATITPNNSTNKNITWSSTDTNVAIVDKNGKVTALSAGTANIQVKSDDGVFDTCVVTVKSVSLTNIKVAAMPAKISYNIGETYLDLTGLVVKGTYSDGSTKTETVKVTDVSGFDTLSAGTKMITISIGGKTTTFKIIVNSNEVVLTSIAVTTLPVNTNYSLGDTVINLAGIVVTGTYSNNTKKTESITTANISGFNTSSAGTKTITVNVNGKTATFTIKVDSVDKRIRLDGSFVSWGGDVFVSPVENGGYALTNTGNGIYTCEISTPGTQFAVPGWVNDNANAANIFSAVNVQFKFKTGTNWKEQGGFGDYGPVTREGGFVKTDGTTTKMMFGQSPNGQDFFAKFDLGKIYLVTLDTNNLTISIKVKGSVVVIPDPEPQPQTKGYGYIEPKMTSVPTILKADTWLNHYKNDIMPFWTMNEAKGNPEGNFPTYRNNDGRLVGNTDRYPRMIARQIYQYSMGYMMTGDESLLKLAKSGVNWLINHAKDRQNGGWYPILDQNGNPKYQWDKFTQDTAYVAMAFGAYNFVSRDKAVEEEMLGIRDLIFTKYWDSSKNRVIDGLDYYMKKEVDMNNNGSDLVAELDQVNGYMMLSQPILSDSGRRTQMLDDMRTLCDTMKRMYWQNKIFFGTDRNLGNFGSQHTDFGHDLKTYWMFLQLDKRLSGNPYQSFINENVGTMIGMAYKDNRSWYEGISGYNSHTGGDASWWVFAEANQLACTLDFGDANNKYSSWLQKTGQTWLDNYVDKNNHEVYSGYGGGEKTSEWKNGFHSTEHALIMYIHGAYIEKKPLELFFAVPSEEQSSFVARPYLFNGDEMGRSVVGDLSIDGKSLKKVKVLFNKIY